MAPDHVAPGGDWTQEKMTVTVLINIKTGVANTEQRLLFLANFNVSFNLTESWTISIMIIATT